MKTFDRYVFKNLMIATIFVSIVLIVVVFLTQSLRFLELVMDSGASSGSFWLLTLLALPRFFEIIVPLALMAAVLFIYNRMTMDSELVVIRSGGYSPIRTARPAIALAFVMVIFLWFMTMWAAPKALSSMNEMRQIIKAQVSSFLFREGVFNQVTKGLTVYIRDHTSGGELSGVMIHDSRDKTARPSTTLAKRGVVVADENGYKVIVSDGSRQEYDREKEVLRRLDFQQYTIDLPSSEEVRQRWSEPDERTIFELLNPNSENVRDMESLRDFKVEIHRRFISPVLALVFVLVSCAALIRGPLDRRGQGKRILIAVSSMVLMQGLFVMASNFARKSDIGLILMYIAVLLPAILSLMYLLRTGDRLRHLIYRQQGGQAS